MKKPTSTIERMADEVRSLKQRVRRLEDKAPLVVPIQTLAPEPFELLQEIKVVVQPTGEDFLASFIDANVNATGRTETDAVANLKDVLVGLFDQLDSLPAKKLGPGPAKQLAVLKSFMRSRT